MAHDFDALYEQYPAVIAQMPNQFTSHQFILRLAQQNQAQYIDALHHYSHAAEHGQPPFLTVHRVLAQQLNRHGDLIARAPDVASVDIFGKPNSCSAWVRKDLQ
jgi:hypothetical protein